MWKNWRVADNVADLRSTQIFSVTASVILSQTLAKIFEMQEMLENGFEKLSFERSVSSCSSRRSRKKNTNHVFYVHKNTMTRLVRANHPEDLRHLIF